MAEPVRPLRRLSLRLPGAAARGVVAGVLLVVALGVGLIVAPRPTPAPPAPQITLRLDPPVLAEPVTRIAWMDEAPVAGPGGGLRLALRAPDPRVAEPPQVAAASPPGADRDDPLPSLVRRAAQPAPPPDSGPVLGYVPAPPRRPDRPPALGPAPTALSGDLATRLQVPEGQAPLDLALGAIAPRLLERSPVPPARPWQAERAPQAAPGAVLAARLDPPPRRPAAVARLAATPTLAALTVVPPAAPAPAVAMIEPAPLATRSSADGCGAALARAIPRRPRSAAGGREVLAGLAGAGGTTRDAALVRAVEQGNVPDHLRQLVPVTMAGTQPDGRRVQITLCVMPDYLAVGSDQDFVRIPLGLPAANRLAERFDMLLPTARMVDAIHAQARVRLTPSPMTPGAQMASTGYLVTHNATVEAQRRATGAALGHLVSGHKKDVVLTNRLTRVSGRVAIYGWHRGNGQPIQPLSTVHGQHYADYSHGIRLISRTAFVGGRAVDLLDLLADRRYAGVLTGDEGPIATRQIFASLR